MTCARAHDALSPVSGVAVLCAALAALGLAYKSSATAALPRGATDSAAPRRAGAATDDVAGAAAMTIVSIVSDNAGSKGRGRGGKCISAAFDSSPSQRDAVRAGGREPGQVGTRRELSRLD